VNIESKTNLKKNVANFFGAFGYIFCSLQWIWVILLYFSLINKFALFIDSNSNSQVTKSTTTASFDSNILLTIIAIIIAIVVVVFALYILIKIPSTLVKTGKKIVHETAENTAPLVLMIQHQKDTKRNHIKITARLILIIKTILIIIPVILTFMSQFLEKQMISFYIAMCVSILLVCLSIVFFIFQYFIAILLQVKRQNLW
jgi:hypothetical protein